WKAGSPSGACSGGSRRSSSTENQKGIAGSDSEGSGNCPYFFHECPSQRRLFARRQGLFGRAGLDRILGGRACALQAPLRPAGKPRAALRLLRVDRGHRETGRREFNSEV